MTEEQDLRVDRLFRVEDKVALVTGGTRGIGLMIAAGLVANGAVVYITSRKQAACDKAVQLIKHKYPKARVVGFASDVSDEKGCLKVAEFMQSKENKIDILVNNAGTNWAENIDTYPESAFQKVFQLNVFGYFSLTQKLLPLLQAAGTKKNPARVINIGSIDGVRIVLERYAYSSSKAAVHHLTKTLASKLAERNITVNAVLPGPFPSKMMKETLDKFEKEISDSLPLSRIGATSDMAGIVLYLASPASSYVTGAIIPVDGGALVKSSL